MRTKKSLTAVMAAALLLAVNQVDAQISYNGDDLLLNFRNTANVNPVSGVDLEVDLGPVSSIASLTGSEIAVPASLVTGVFGAPSVSAPVGISASAADDGSSTLWLSRVDTTPGTAPTTVSAQQITQDNTVTAIDNIGNGAAGGTPDGAGAATVTAATSGGSYQAQGEQNTSAAGQAAINFGSSQNINASKGGAIESVQNGSGNVYEALWEVPPTGTGSDTYLGYFTIQPSGEVDYTSVTSVPEPSTYVLLLATGVMGLLFRRRIRSLSV